jgi:hypothetical protein
VHGPKGRAFRITHDAMQVMGEKILHGRLSAFASFAGFVHQEN